MRKLLHATLSLLALLLFTHVAYAQTSHSETFESFTDGATSFTSSGQVFNIVSQTPTPDQSAFTIDAEYPGSGWNAGTSNPDNVFIDEAEGLGNTNNVNPVFGISSATAFQVKSFYLFLTDENLNLSVSGSVTITGFSGSTQVFQVTKSSGFSTSYGTNNGFTLIDLSTLGGTDNSTKSITKLQISTGGAFSYVALDYFTWITPATATAPTLSALTTDNQATAIGLNSATLSGNMTATGGASVTARGVAYGTTANPTTAGSKVNETSAAFSTGAFSENATGLASSTIYHYRAYATNTAGTTYGPDITFRTLTGITSVSVPANKTYKIGDQLSFTVNFTGNAYVTGTPYIDVTIGATHVHANYQSGSGSMALVFNYTVAAGDLDTDGITINSLALNGGTIQDASSGGNAAVLTLNNIGSTAAVNVDGIAPTVTVSSTAGASGSTTATLPIPFTLTFSKAVTAYGSTSTVLSASAVTVTNGTVSSFTGSGTSYSFNVTPSGTNAVTVSIPINSAQDGDGNGNIASAAYTLTPTGPTTVTSINRNSPTAATTNNATVSYTVTFGASVSGLTASNFSLTGTAATGSSISNVTGSGATYTVTVAVGATDGTLTLNLANATGISPGVSNAPYTSGQTYTINRVAPTVVISNTDPSPTNANVLDFQAVFSEPVSNVTAADFVMTNSGVTSGAISLTQIDPKTCNITVINVSGTGTARLDLKGGTTIADAAGNTPAASTGFTYTIDQTPPTITSITAPGTNPTTATTVNYTVTFSEAVTGVVATYFTATTVSGNVAGTVSAVTGTGTTYTVTVSSITGTGTLRLDLKNNSTNIVDAAGNSIASGYVSGQTYTILNTPVITTTSGSAAYTGSAIAIDPGLTVSDPSSPVLSSATISITGNLHSGEDVLSFNNNVYGNISGSYNALTGVMFLSSSGSTATLAQWIAALQSVTYSNSSSSPNTATRTISFNVTDANSQSSNTATKTVTVTAPSTVSSINRSTPATALTNSSTVSYAVTFGAPVNNLFASNFSLTGTAATGSAVSAVSGSGANYTVSVAVGSTDGTLTLNLANATGISPVISNVPYTSGQTYTIDRTAPAAPVITSPANGVTITTTQPTISGTAEANSTVNIFVDNGAMGSTSADGSGNWSFLTPTVLSYGSHIVTANATDAANNTGPKNTGNAFTVAQSAVITFAANNSVIYGTADYLPGATSTNTVTPITYISSNATVATITTDGKIHIVGVGNTTITASQVAGGTYTTATSVPQSLTVTPASLTITADNQTKIYGAVMPALTASYHGFVNNDNAGNLTTAPTISTTATATSPVANSPYQISVSGAVDPNYTITYAPGTLTVNQAPLDITANSVTKTVGTTITGGAGSTAFTYSGNQNNETVGSVTIAYGTGSAAGAPVATYTGSVVASAAIGGTFNASNYSITYHAGDITVTPAPLPSINAPGTVAAMSTTYGQASGTQQMSISGANLTGNITVTAPTGFEVSSSSGAGFGNTVTLIPSGGTLSASTVYIRLKSSTGAGSYSGLTVVITSTGATSKDVSISTSVVAPAAITVTADAQTKVYGQADPALTYKITSGALVGADAFSGSLTRDAGENIGNYAIKQGTLALSSNYTLSYVGANLTITPAAITVTADAQTKVYGQADPTLTYKVTLGALVGSDAFAGSLTRTAGETVNTYAITQGTLALSSNYTLTYTGANLTITPAAITVTADAQTKVYGQADPALTYKVTSGALVGSDAFSGSLTRDAGETVGSYVIKQGTLALNNNYTLTYVGANLTITPAAITVTADAQTKVYGQADPTLTYKVTSGALVGSDAFTGLLTRTNGENIGTYAIGQGTLALNSNYTLSYVGANLTITPAAITVTADAQTKVYGQADPALTYKVTSGALVGLDAFSGSLTRDAGENIGNYAIKQGTLALSSNYTLSYLGANLNITPAAITVTADAQTKVYGQADPTLTYKVTSGALVGSDAFSGSLARAAGETVGNYAINQGSLALSNNYTLTYTGANLTITPAAITVTADAKTKAFGQPDPALTYSVTSGALKFSDTFTGSLTRVAGESIGMYAIEQGSLALNGNYSLTYVGAELTIGSATASLILSNLNQTYDGTPKPATVTTNPSGLSVVSVTYNGSATAPTNAGSYLVDAKLTNSSYTAPDATGMLVIGKADEAITFNALPNKTYGDADFALSATSTNTGLPVTYISSNTAVATIVSGSIHIVGAGSTTITASQAGDANHNAATDIPQTLTITPAAITVTADAQTKVYGQADPALTYKVTSGALVGSDAFTGALTRDAGENIGNYNIKQGTLALNSNYSLTYVGADLTITPAAITVTADAQTKVYGQADPALTYKVTSGALVGSDAFSGSLTRDAGENIGNYNIKQGTLALSSNYTLSYVGANLTITPAAITVTADAQTKVYGQADPLLTYKVTSGALVGSDAFSGSLTRDAGENIGNYAINQGTLALNSNYSLTYVGANLTITPATITVTADAQTKVYGQTDPALTYKVTSGALVGSDAFSGALTRVAGETVGTYAIGQGTLALNSNYTLSYVGANLTITPAALTITADNQTKVFGTANPVLTASYSGFVNGDDAGSLTTAPTLSTNATVTSPAGHYTITAGGAADANYTITYVAGILTVTQATLTITADNQTKVYGQANPALTVTYSGFVNGDNSGSLTTQPAVSTTATASSSAGNYPITVSGAAIANYNIVYVPGTLTVTKASLTVTADNQSRNYGVANPALTVTYSGFVNGDSQASLTTQATATTTATTGSAPGTYPIKPAGAVSANYTFSYVNGVLTVIPLTNASLSGLSVSAGTLSPDFDTNTHAYNVTVENAVQQLELTATFDPTATATVNGDFTPNGGASSPVSLNVGNNTLTVTVTAQDGTTTQTYTVTVYRGEPLADITATNILTPNGDGKNDTWVVKDIELYPNNNVTVYDRGGRVVFSQHHYQNDWAGTINGQPLQEGTYYYVVDLGGRTIKGFITLLRSR